MMKWGFGGYYSKKEHRVLQVT